LSYTIRIAAGDQKARIASFVKRQQRTLYPEGTYDPDPDDLRRFEETYCASPRARFFLATDEAGDIAGTGAIRPYNGRFPFLAESVVGETAFELVRFYIDEPYRRRGIGAALFAEAEHFAVANGYTLGVLHTSVYLPGAYPFWKSRGYEDSLWENEQIVHMRKRMSRAGTIDKA